MKPPFEVGAIISRFKESFYERHACSRQVRKVFTNLEQCRTRVLGGHVDACPDCGYVRISYNSCRDRHCPKCQGMERELWIQSRKEELLPVKYFHVVFTLPQALHPLLLSQGKFGFRCLFLSSWQTLCAFARNQGVQTGMVALLHTWGSNLTFHPHLHCIVPAGGVTDKGEWKEFPNARNKSPYLFPVKGMSAIFRAKFMALLSEQVKLPQSVRKELFSGQWVVFCKYPFYGRERVVEYIGRYSHRVAISNSRIKAVDEENVTFDYKDYKQGGRHRLMTLTGVEFLRRFSLHVLPKGFVRIRHYGFLAGTNREKLRVVQQELGAPLAPVSRRRKKWKEICVQNELEYSLCPLCKQAQLITVEVFERGRPPPAHSYPKGHDRADAPFRGKPAK